MTAAARYIRGFSLNVANYAPLGLESPCPTEAFGTTAVHNPARAHSLQQ